ncbi:hypothetical protein SporoP37_04840 [Sporosarcina sp. P37]|uniref:hypothetical protein n=1 Tax=unclassified Sporosarcina TaxID=2647733 RepID=UPI000A17F570|nr:MULTISPECIES: hypothetical protein [unclassified Sporosarcina]ARK24073.1 hypothetical protein SporoP37_04840 [Sporosarcina sp. P37]PID18534.1 hypothetical protein CSV62_07740 [Sporosarcina sp. P35]
MKITPGQPVFRTPQTQKPAAENDKAANKNSSAPDKPVDQYIPSETVKSVTYEKPSAKADTATIERLKAESEQAYENLRNIVRELLERQGITMKEALSGEKEVVVDEQTRLQAEAAISDGGEFSAENVSDRIIEFANAISGGDKSTFEVLKNAIEEGFHAAKQALGGTLPDVSQKTYELVMEKLNNWKEEA